MKKIIIVNRTDLFKAFSKKTLRIMKLTSFLFLVTIFNVFGSKSYAQYERLNLDMKDATLEAVLTKIESQSNFFFLYSSKMIDVNQKVDIKVDDKKITEVLDELLENTDINYIVRKRQILLVNKEAEAALVLQQKIVTGTVTGADAKPLTGVNVVITGSTIGTITGIDGKYSIEVQPGTKSLTFSFIGMEAQEINIGTLTVINVTMAESAVGLEEVVVIGYGTTKKITLTGSVASISSKDLKTSSTDNISTQLAGKLPGLRVTQRTGEPGAFSTVYDIRGLGTPLIVVNGVVTAGTDFVRINPADIEQISILKDASAAVYGVKAANGVILVTTKRGEIGKPKISYSGSYTMSKYSDFPQACDAYEFAWLTTQNEINHGRAPNATTYSSDDLQKYKDGTYPSTNWFDLVTRKYATSQKHNINISGGSDRITYFTSFGNVKENGIWKSDDLNYQRYNARTDVVGKITNNLEAEISMDFMLDERNQSGNASDITETIWVHSLPTLPVFANNNPDYLAEQAVGGHHALAEMSSSYSGYIKTRNRTFQGIATLNYKVPFVNGLRAKFMFAYYSMDQYTRQWKKEFKLYKYDITTDTYSNTSTVNSPSNLTGIYSPLFRTSFLTQLNYDKVLLEKHSIRASVIYENRYDINDNLQAKKEFAIDIDQFYAGISNPTVTSSNINENNNQSIIGRLNYDFLSKYLLEFGFNYNGSSRFPKGKRWGFFPYGSIGWRLSEEEFFKSALPYITNLKIRGSLGIMGDDAASSFQFLTGYTYPSGNYVFNNKLVSNLGFRGIPNPNITWYTINTKNFGIDANLFNGLINLQFDLFQRDRSGLLATRALTIPGTVGATLPQENLNKDRRKGFELVLGQSRTVGNLHYEISASVTYTRGMATYLERTADGNSYLNWRNNTTGRWDNITWGYNYIGQFQSQDDLNNSPIQDSQGNKTLQPGDYKYEDVNKDGLITSLDQIPIGRGTVPDINFGLNGSVNFRQFDLTILLQGASNYNHTRESFIRGTLPWNRNCLKMYLDLWHHEDIYDVNSPWIPGKYASASTNGTPASNGYVSQKFLEDAKYLRLKNMEIGYTFSKTFLSKVRLEDLRIYVSGFNLFTISEMKNFDPEIVQDRLYPIMRDVTFGLNITF